MKKCKQCKQKMIKRGFGTVGGLTGEARLECNNTHCTKSPMCSPAILRMAGILPSSDTDKDTDNTQWLSMDGRIGLGFEADPGKPLILSNNLNCTEVIKEHGTKNRTSN